MAPLLSRLGRGYEILHQFLDKSIHLGQQRCRWAQGCVRGPPCGAVRPSWKFAKESSGQRVANWATSLIAALLCCGADGAEL